MGFFEDIPAIVSAPSGIGPSPGSQDVTDTVLPSQLPRSEQMEFVVLPDHRQEVLDTQIVPYRCIAQLLVDFGGPQPDEATGWFISPSVIVTAGHVLLARDSSGTIRKARSVRVVPGRNGTIVPYGFFDTSNIRVSDGWANNYDPAGDYGAVHLDKPIGQTIGWFGFGIFKDTQFDGVQFSIVGYPTDKQVGTLWGQTGPVQVGSAFLSYRMSTYLGQSGSPLYVVVNGAAWVAGIHTGAQDDVNTAIRITQPVYDELVSWRS